MKNLTHRNGLKRQSLVLDEIILKGVWQGSSTAWSSKTDSVGCYTISLSVKIGWNLDGKRPVVPCVIHGDFKAWRHRTKVSNCINPACKTQEMKHQQVAWSRCHEEANLQYQAALCHIEQPLVTGICALSSPDRVEFHIVSAFWSW